MSIIGIGSNVNYEITASKVVDDILTGIQYTETNKRDMSYMIEDSKPTENIVKGLLAIHVHNRLKERFGIVVPMHLIDIRLSDMKFDDFNKLKSFKVIPDYGKLNKYKKQINVILMEVLTNESNRNN